ncbi:hypothetical protein VPHK479_0035 [Vibrio phage K479]
MFRFGGTTSLQSHHKRRFFPRKTNFFFLN